MKKKILSTAVFVLFLAGVVWGAQLVIDQVGVYTTPQAMMQAIDDNFDELYLKWTNLGATHDTSGELDALYLSDQTIGIADDNLLEVDDAAAADGDIAVFTANGIEGVPTLGYATTDGSYKSATPTIDDPDNWTMSGAGVYGGIWIANAAGTGALPPVTAGMKVTVLVEGANTVVLNPDGTGTADTIYLDGAVETQDENITTDGTSGAIVVCIYRSADAWSCTGDGNWDGATD